MKPSKHRTFSRHPRKIHLTQSGHELLKETKSAIFTLEQALKLETDSLISNINLETILSFATHWLLPHLPEFHALYPDITINTSTNSRVVDLNRREVDVAIRYGKDNYPGLCVYPLFIPASVVICKPDVPVWDEQSSFCTVPNITIIARWSSDGVGGMVGI